jgi:hypothetical protein
MALSVCRSRLQVYDKSSIEGFLLPTLPCSMFFIFVVQCYVHCWKSGVVSVLSVGGSCLLSVVGYQLSSADCGLSGVAVGGFCWFLLVGCWVLIVDFVCQFFIVGAQLWIEESMLFLGEKRLNEVLLEMMIIATSAHRKS